jgi:hypothetical protein
MLHVCACIYLIKQLHLFILGHVAMSGAHLAWQRLGDSWRLDGALVSDQVGNQGPQNALGHRHSAHKRVGIMWLVVLPDRTKTMDRKS